MNKEQIKIPLHLIVESTKLRVPGTSTVPQAPQQPLPSTERD